jgi:hypothetical protein
MIKMRAKLQLATVTKTEGPQEILKFHGVCKDGGYPADGSDEDNTFAKWSPSIELTMVVANPALHGAYQPGQKFYVDFTPVESAATAGAAP